MYAKILIPIVIILIAVAACQPMLPNSNMVSGVFIPSDTMNSLEQKARTNSQNINSQMQNNPSVQRNSSPTDSGNQQSTNPNSNDQNTQMNSNSEAPRVSVYQAPTPANNQQPTYSNQQPTVTLQMVPVNTQRQQINTQPIIVTQPQNQQPLNQQPIILTQQPNQQYVLTPSNEPNQQTILVAQPNQQAILVNPQNNQPLLVNPQNNQALLVNTQNNRPVLVNSNNQPLLLNTQNRPLIVSSNQLPNLVVQNPVTNPNILSQVITNQNSGLLGKTLPNQGNQIYAVVPVNNQNVPNNNMNNGNTYLVPIQEVPSNTVLVNTGK